MKVPLKLDADTLRAMLGAQGASLEPVTKTKVLFVDEEMYGPVEFPISMFLARGQIIRFPGYGNVQVLTVNMETIRCTQTLDQELFREYQLFPQPPDPTPPVRPGVASSCSTKRNAIPGPVAGSGIPGPVSATELGSLGPRTTAGPTDRDPGRETPVRFL